MTAYIATPNGTKYHTPECEVEAVAAALANHRHRLVTAEDIAAEVLTACGVCKPEPPTPRINLETVNLSRAAMVVYGMMQAFMDAEADTPETLALANRLKGATDAWIALSGLSVPEAMRYLGQLVGDADLGRKPALAALLPF